MRFCLLDVDQTEESGQTLLRLWGRTADGKSVCVLDPSYLPYFYVQPGIRDLRRLERLICKACDVEGLPIHEIKIAKLKLLGKPQRFLKITARLPRTIHRIREAVKLFEREEGGKGEVIEEFGHADPVYRKYMIDRGFLPLSWLEATGKVIKPELAVDIVLRAGKIRRINTKKPPSLELLAFDIECAEEAGQNKIIMVSFFGNGWRKVLTYRAGRYPRYVEVVKDEKEMLQHFVNIIIQRNPDFLITFNGDEFDFPALRERADALGVKLQLSRDGSPVRFIRRARRTTAKLRGIVHLDLYKFVDNILAPELAAEVLDLSSVTAELLGEKKLEIAWEKILEMWREKKDLAPLARYCLHDSELTLKLANFLLPQVFEMCRVAGQLPFDTCRMTYSVLVEWYLIRRAPEFGVLPPNRPITEVIEARRRKPPFVGAYVKEPTVGLHEDVIVYDFKSLYPTLIATFNIEPSMFRCACCRGNGWQVPDFKDYWFCKKRKGYISQVIQELITRRKQIKEQMRRLKPGTLHFRALDARQYALKILANAFYGYLGFSGARWYCREAAESCTAFGRDWIRRIAKWAEEAGFEVIYADTDSIFVKIR